MSQWKPPDVQLGKPIIRLDLPADFAESVQQLREAAERFHAATTRLEAECKEKL